ncbi:hypothetical protein EDB87DRAFT_622356 [Lactarius vividus]|nr:hypothetical protein EDB87DRAFT_622356 [Lactarius vividus]
MTSTAAASSGFQLIFNAALKSYKKQTKKDLIAHPLASQLQSCDSTSAILAVLQEQVRQFDQAHSGDERFTKWLIPTVNVLYAFSAAVSEGVGLVFSPAKVIFAGIGVLLSASILSIFWQIDLMFGSYRLQRMLQPAKILSQSCSNV